MSICYHCIRQHSYYAPSAYLFNLFLSNDEIHQLSYLFKITIKIKFCCTHDLRSSKHIPLAQTNTHQNDNKCDISDMADLSVNFPQLNVSVGFIQRSLNLSQRWSYIFDNSNHNIKIKAYYKQSSYFKLLATIYMVPIIEIKSFFIFLNN